MTNEKGTGSEPQRIGFVGMAVGMGILVAAVGTSSVAGSGGVLVLVGFSVFN